MSATRDAEPGAEAARAETKPPATSRRMVNDITRQMREMILSREIPPGSVLLQTEWAERLKVSRTPLREAFRILEQDGLVRASNGNRTIRVVRFSPDELRDLYEVREVIDGLAARLLASNGLPAELDDELNGYLAEMDAATEPFLPARWFPAHTNFHLRIAECCGNGRMRQQLDLIKMTSFSLHSHLVELAESGDRLPHVLEVARTQHRAIYDALRSGSGDLAEMAACRHIRATLRSNLISGPTG